MKWLFPLLALSSTLLAYAPLIPKGCRLLTAGYSRFETEHFYDKQGTVKKSYNHFMRNQIDLKVEYGISSRNSLAIWSAFDLIDDHLNGHAYSIADAEVTFKQALKTTERSILAAELVAIIPYAYTYHPELRYGRLGAEGALLYAQTFFPYGIKTTVDARLGYRWYSGFPSDQVRAALAAWIDLSCRWQLLAQTSIEYGLFNGKEPLNRSFFFFNANYRVWKGSLEAIYYISAKTSLTLGYRQHFYGQNIAVGGEVYGTLAFSF